MQLNKTVKEVIFYKLLFKVIPRKLKFKLIYKYNLWNSGESISGPGSEVSSLSGIEAFLDELIRTLNIRSILDIPCGDFNWMKTVDLSGVQYTGADIISDLVRKNQELYGTSKMQFKVLDIVKDDLPKCDLVIIKDLFIHFSMANILESIDNLRRSGSRYILTTTFPDVKQNIAIRDGYNFNINLQLPPFSFGEPLCFFEEVGLRSNSHGKRGMALWAISNL